MAAFGSFGTLYIDGHDGITLESWHEQKCCGSVDAASIPQEVEVTFTFGWCGDETEAAAMIRSLPRIRLNRMARRRRNRIGDRCVRTLRRLRT